MRNQVGQSWYAVRSPAVPRHTDSPNVASKILLEQFILFFPDFIYPHTKMLNLSSPLYGAS